MPNSANSAEAMILYAEDTDAQRYALSRVLRRAGFEVLEAATGHQALEMMTRSPDIVVLDVNLPDINGYEVCRQIKSNTLSCRTPVLHVSATLVTTEARVAGLEGGADAYLVQPVEPEELVATIRALLRVRRAEEELWISQQQYRSFFEANPLACLVVDAVELKILAVNAAAVEQYGYSREEFTALTLGQLLAGQDDAAFINSLSAKSPSWQLNRVCKQKTKSGTVITTEIVSSRLELNGRDARLVIIQDITDKLKREAAEQNELLRRLLLERTLLAQEEERQRIARELHDHAGQLMTSLLVGLRTLSDARRLADAKQQAGHLREITSGAIGELSRLARGLHSTVLDDLGLEQAVQRYAEEFSSAQGIQVDLDFEDDRISLLKKDEQINLYRIVQEALTNVARHSQADRVRITIKQSGSELLLAIADNGCGLLPSRTRHPWQHLGIEGMRQRATMLGGSLEVRSESQQGVSVHVRVPFSDPRRGQPGVGATE